MYFKQKEYGVKYADVGVENFRDLGGIRLQNGRVIAGDRIFRSGELFAVSDGTMLALEKLGIKHVFDLRSLDEAQYKPDAVLKGCVYHNIPAYEAKSSLVINQTRVAELIPSRLPASVSCWGFKLRFKHIYRKLPFKNKAYAAMFDVMDKGESFLFHCTAGKDRTGVASMLILLALGADWETVKQDYMLSNVYREESNERFYRQFEHEKHYDKIRAVLEVACRVDLEMLEISYKAIIRKYKTVSNYFYKEYGADGERLALWIKNYTEQA